MVMCDTSAAAIVKQLFEAYSEAVYKNKYDEVIRFYDADAVLVEKGVACYYGPHDIVQAIKEYHDRLGNSNTENFNERFDKAGEHCIYMCRYRLQSALAKETIEGTYNQIWRKDGDDYKIIRDEFSIENRVPL